MGLHEPTHRYYAAASLVAVLITAREGFSAEVSEAESRSNLYEWIATAPVLVVGPVRRDDTRYLELEVKRSFRGRVQAGSILRVDLKHANREREVGHPPLEMERGKIYLVLLRPAPGVSKRGPPVYRLVRGCDGASTIPAETEEAWLDATTRLAEIQDRKDELSAWRSFARMLEETNPILVETALELFLKFRRGDASLLPAVRPLLDHPRHDFRERAAQLLGQVIVRSHDEPLPDLEEIQSELIAHARRDDSTDVRVAATRSLGSLQNQGIEEVLSEIAREDPDQSVRYEAERVLFERRTTSPAPGRRKEPSPAIRGEGALSTRWRRARHPQERLKRRDRASIDLPPVAT